MELGGALKNVLALACGISDGLNFGCNGRAALITRGLSEMTRLAVALGAHPLTMGGLAGMGDLVLTCTGASAALTQSTIVYSRIACKQVRQPLLPTLKLALPFLSCTSWFRLPPKRPSMIALMP